MKNIILLFLLNIVIQGAYAQLSVRGKITAQGEMISNASVSLLKSSDSTLIKLAITDKTGNFEFMELADSSYLILATSIGFDPVYLRAQTGVQMQIELIRSAQDMTAVTITARKPIIEARADKLIVNVDAAPSNAGATVLELLEKSPGIAVDQDGNIQVKGKQGVMVLIDGRPTYLSGQDLASLLRSMPAAELDQVEIMTQPSAKFDAAGNSGIINLKTKKSRKTGLNGSVSVGYMQGVYPKSPNNFNFNYRKGRVNLFANGGYTYWEQYNEQNISRKFKPNGITNAFDQTGRSTNYSNNYTLRTGIDVELNSKNTIGIVLNGNYSGRNQRSVGSGIFYTNLMQGADSTISSLNSSHNPWKNFSVNTNFRRQTGREGSVLSADLDYIQYSSKQEQFTDNRVGYEAAPTSVYLLRAVLPSEIRIMSGKIDYTHSLSKQTKLEGGLKASYVQTDNNAPYEYYDFDAGVWADDARKDHFLYTEQISAAYINYNSTINKFSIQAGLRAEHTHSTGKQVLIGKKIPRDYFQFFPTAFIGYAVNEHHQLSMNYGRRIDRPNYRDLNPFQYFLDLYTFNQGNPYLNPQFTHNIELLHVLKNKLTTTFNYTYTNDIINDILKQNDNTKVTYQTKENVASRRNIGLSLSYNAPVTPWWTTSLYGNIFNNHYEGMVNNALLKTSITSFSFNFNQQFRFAKTWSAEMSGFYQGRSLFTGMFLLEPMYVLSFGGGKQIMKNKGTLKLSINDPFLLQKVTVKVKHDNINMLLNNIWDNRRIGITFTYRFSKGAAIQQKNKSGSAADEQRRIGGEN